MKFQSTKLKSTSKVLAPFFLSLLCGSLYALGFPIKGGYHLPFLSWLGIFLFFFFFLFSKKNFPSLKRGMILVLFFSIGMNLAGYYWLSYTLSEFGGLFFPWNVLLAQFFALIVLPHFFVFWAMAFYLFKLTFFLRPLVLSGLFVLCEMFVPQQFPGHLGHTFLAFSPYIKPATWFGHEFYSFLLIFTFFSWFIPCSRFYRFTSSFLVFITGFLSVLFPLTKYPLEDKTNNSHTKTLAVRFVQPNIGHIFKIEAERGHQEALEIIQETLISLSTRPWKLEENFPKLLLWPETAHPNVETFSVEEWRQNTEGVFLSNTPHKAFVETRKQLESQTLPVKSYLLTGNYRMANNETYSDEMYNSSILLSPEGKVVNFYDKKKLLPFGEGLPILGNFQQVRNFFTQISFFTPGTRFPFFEIKEQESIQGTTETFSFITAICYEILFPLFIREYLNSSPQQIYPDFIVNLTNDSWYGHSSEPYQHLYLGHWRAIEFQLPILRSTNTGITGILYPDGTTSSLLPYETKNTLDVLLTVPKNSKPTLYSIWGPWGLIGFWSLLALVLFLFHKAKRHLFLFFGFFSLFIFNNCSYYDEFKGLSEEPEIPTQVYSYPFNNTWTAISEIMKKYDLAIQNQETGTMKTEWIDNTLELNFADSFGSSDAIKSAKFRLTVQVSKGHKGAKEVSKVSVFKQQIIEKDFLQGNKLIPSDLILEKVILYRLERLLQLDAKIRKLDQLKISKERERLLEN